ncbi:MAG TPA: FecR family protein [Bacteroidota bacterium]|nr:FecR family protein [Bacteroidota bacterium]
MKQLTIVQRKILITLLLISILTVSMGFYMSNSTVALVTKIIQDVSKKSGDGDWKPANKGESLTSGDRVKTGQKSLAVIKFLDNSIVRVREQSELSISSEGPRGSATKTVQLNGGSLGFDIKKQQNEQFRLTSPTSVASIRGTKGKMSGGSGTDTVIVTEGLVNLFNSLSEKNFDIIAGFIGFSTNDGSTSSREATPEELADALNAATGGSENELNLELRDSKGNKKELKIKYKQ